METPPSSYPICLEKNMATITVGQNSWITNAEADTYLDCKFGADAWATATEDNQNKAIISAFWAIYGNKNYSIAKTSTDEKVKNAQAETAFFILSYNAEMTKRKALQAAGVKEFEVSKFREKYDKSGSFLPPEAENLLNDFQAWSAVGTMTRTND